MTHRAVKKVEKALKQTEDELRDYWRLETDPFLSRTYVLIINALIRIRENLTNDDEDETT